MPAFILPPVDIDALPRTATGIIDLDPDWLNVDACRFQFKSGGDEFGVTERLRGVSAFEVKLCGVVIVWQDKQGRLFIVDGHQRMGLARTARANGQVNGIYLPARIYREEDGISAEDVKVIAAFKNIAEGTGSSVDVARVIKQYGDLPATIPPRSALVRQARALSLLGNDVFNAVCSGVISPELGVVIGHILAQHKHNAEISLPKAEQAIFKAFCCPKTRPSNEIEAYYLAREIIRTGVMDIPEDNLSLFPHSEADNLLKERAEILAVAQKMLREEASNLRVVLRDERRINSYIAGGGSIDRERVIEREQELIVARLLFESGWKYRDINLPLTQLAGKYGRLRQKAAQHEEIKQLVALLDGTLSARAHDLKLAKLKGEKNDAAMVTIRAAFAREFIGAIQAFLVHSEVARDLRRSLGRKAQEGPNRPRHRSKDHRARRRYDR